MNDDMNPMSEDEALTLDGDTRIKNTADRMARVRAARGRKVAKRTKASVRAMAAPEPAERAEVAREPRMPDAHEPVRRRRRSERQLGAFDVPEHLKKRGWDYQYLPVRVLGEPVDGSLHRDFREGGWRPCKAKDWPDLVDPGTPGDAPVETGGQRLYERPMSLTLEARKEDLEYAYAQQHDKMRQAASGVSARRGEQGIPDGRGVRAVPVEVQIEGVMG